MVNFKVALVSHGVQSTQGQDAVHRQKKLNKRNKNNKNQSTIRVLGVPLNFISKYPILRAFLVYPKKSIYDLFLFWHFVTKFLGLSSFSVPDTIKSTKLHIAFLDILTYVLFMVSSIFVLVASVFDNYEETDSVLLNMGIKTILFSSLVLSIPPSTLNIINRYRIWKITQLVSTIDHQLLQLGVKIDHRTDFYRLGIIVIMTSLLFVISCAIHFYPFTDQIISWSYYFFILYSKGCYYAFCVSSGSYYAVIHNRLCHLNRAIVSNYNIHTNYIKRRVFVISKTNRSLIVLCSEIYEKINQVLDLINYCFSIPLMFCIGICFVYTVFTIYSGFRMFKYQVNDKEFYFSIRNTLWNLLFALCQLFIIVIGHKITCDGKKTAYLAHLAIGQDVADQQLHDNFIFLSQQIRHRTPVSSCWLFSFDWTLMYSIAAALATYLIVLLQVENEISALNIN